MNHGTLRTVAILSLLPLAGCMQSDQPGPFAGNNGAAAASSITRSAGAYSGESMATGSNVNNAAQATIVILAKHQATAKQHAVAVQRAKAAVAHLQKATAAHPGKKLPRYIAVDTVKDEHTAPKAAKACMIWDTQAQDVVGNTVYDIASTPPTGATSRFETYSAEYVGASL
jgi:hypothetical protein